MRLRLLLYALLVAAPVSAQESRLHADFRREAKDVAESCGGGFDAKKLVGCAVTIATDDPLHLAIGSLAPQNGTAFGLAFAEHTTPNTNWRISWNADAVAATSGSWRTGAYVKLIHIPSRPPIVVVRPGGSGSTATPTVAITEYPVYNFYAQATSLNTLFVEAGQGAFSEKQTIAGASVIHPIGRPRFFRALRPAFVGAVNGRFLNVRSGDLGLDEHPSFAQFQEGLRIRPSLFNDRLRLNYLADLQQFLTSENTHASFHRWTLDLKHEFPLYRTVSSTGPRETNGPDECFESLGSPRCPPVSYSRNLEGSIGVRVLSVRSGAGGGNAVPFYLQPTLGGSDINGQRLLSAFDDYRFRGPNLLAIQESVEHSIWGPFGAYALVEQGRITGDGATGSEGMRHSFAIGLTVRAGGFPLINLSFAWGNEGHHTIGSIDPSLLGGSARPSLY